MRRMSILVVHVDWRSPDPGAFHVLRGLGACSHRAPDGRRLSRWRHATLGIGLRVTTPRQQQAGLFAEDRAAGLAVVGDMQLHERETLQAQLDLIAAASDADLVLAAYQRWGDDLAERLCGDFAFAIWDSRRRRLIAARDALGTRCLYSRAGGETVTLASDVRSLLVLPECRREPDPDRILAFLTNRPAAPAATFFTDVRLLPAGHVLVATAEGVAVRRWYRPPQIDSRLSDPAEATAAYRAALRRAVAARMDSDGPVVIHLSGGLDSSAVACAARDYVADRGGPGVILVSALYPGFPSDESQHIAAARAALPFPWAGYDATRPAPEDLDDPLPHAPAARLAIGDGPWDDLAIARAHGARVILAGSGGDEIAWAEGVCADLASAGRWNDLARWLFRRMGKNWRTFAWHAREALIPRWPALGSPQAVGSTPPWLGPDLAPYWGEQTDDVGPTAFASHTQRSIWQEATTSQVAMKHEWWINAVAEAGLELRLPYLDRRLLDVVLSIPFAARVDERPRDLHRRAIGTFVPDAIAARRDKAIGSTSIVHHARLMSPRIRARLSSHDWRAERYVRRGHLQRICRRLEGRPLRSEDLREWQLLYRSAALDAWLYGLGMYHPSKREDLDERSA